MTVQKGGWDYFDESFEKGGQTDPNGLTVASIGDVPGTLSVPQINATNAPKVTLDAGAGQVVHYIGVIINPLDDVTAAQRFVDGDCAIMAPDSIISKQSGSTITDVYICGLGDADAGGVIVLGTETLTNALAQQTHWTFDSVDAVKRVQLTTTPTRTSAQIMDVSLSGASYE